MWVNGPFSPEDCNPAMRVMIFLASPVRADDEGGYDVPDTTARWVGNGYLPGHFGLWGVTGPLVVVEIAGSRLTLRLRPKFLARLLGVAPLTTEPGSGLRVATARVRAGWGWFVRFQLPGERCYSFQTTATRKDEILVCLADAGYDVPMPERR